MKKGSSKNKRQAKPVTSKVSGARPSITRSKAPVTNLVTVRQGARCEVGVVHREYVRDVYAANGDGSTYEFNLSPTDTTTFPWLSQLARCFDYYDFRSLAFHYVPRCSATSSGSVMGVFDYDVSDSHQSDKRAELAALEGVVETHMFEEFKVVANSYHLHILPHRYCNTTGTDPRLQSVGTFMLNALSVVADNSQLLCGGLWVEYNVRLFSPQPPEHLLTLQYRQTNPNESGNSTIFAATDTVQDPSGQKSLVDHIDYVSGSKETALRLASQAGRYLLSMTVEDVDNSGPTQTVPLIVSPGRGVATKLVASDVRRLDTASQNPFWDIRYLVDVLGGAPSSSTVSAVTEYFNPSIWLQSLSLGVGRWLVDWELAQVSSSFKFPLLPSPASTSSATSATTTSGSVGSVRFNTSGVVQVAQATRPSRQ